MTRFGLIVVPLLLGGLTASTSPPLPRPADPPPSASWPLTPGPDAVVRDFNPPLQPWLAGNRGVDLAGHVGQPVRAATAGIVTFAGTIAGVGVVTVTDGPLRTTYEPVRVTVRRGQRVAVGEVLGGLTLMGSHCLPEVCLHWGLLRGSDYLDPLALLGLERIRLLPIPVGEASPSAR